MKNNLIIVAIFFVANIFAQNSGVGTVVEYNKVVSGELEIFNPDRAEMISVLTNPIKNIIYCS